MSCENLNKDIILVWDLLQQNEVQIYFDLGVLKVRDEYARVDNGTCKVDVNSIVSNSDEVCGRHSIGKYIKKRNPKAKTMD